MVQIREELFGAFQQLRVLGYSREEILCEVLPKTEIHGRPIFDIIAALCEQYRIPVETIKPSLEYYLAEIEDHKEIALDRLRKVHRAMFDLLENGGATFKVPASRTIISAIDRESKLLGLDAPIKVDSTTRELGYVIEGVDMGQIAGTGNKEIESG